MCWRVDEWMGSIWSRKIIHQIRETKNREGEWIELPENSIRWCSYSHMFITWISKYRIDTVEKGAEMLFIIVVPSRSGKQRRLCSFFLSLRLEFRIISMHWGKGRENRLSFSRTEINIPTFPAILLIPIKCDYKKHLLISITRHILIETRLIIAQMEWSNWPMVIDRGQEIGHSIGWIWNPRSYPLLGIGFCVNSCPISVFALLFTVNESWCNCAGLFHSHLMKQKQTLQVGKDRLGQFKD